MTKTTKNSKKKAVKRKTKSKSFDEKVEEFVEKIPERGYAFMKGLIIGGAEKTVKPMTRKELDDIRTPDEESIMRMI
jgi:hypothetical protein